MIKVNWPLNGTGFIGDLIICDWLENLVETSKGEMVFELKDRTEIYFYNEEDAMAFKLRFGFGKHNND